VLRALKSAVFDGLKVVILVVSHKASDPIDVESEVEGRVHHVEIPRWSLDDLLAIAEQGFDALRLKVPRNVQRRICEDGFGNPLLVQEICHELSEARLAVGLDGPPMEPGGLAQIYDRVVERKGLTHFERLGHTSSNKQAPQNIALRGGGEEALPMVLLRAIARLGPRPLTSYSEIFDSLSTLTRRDPPQHEQVAAALSAMANVTSDGEAASLEWLQGRQELAITEPLLMFYLRWVLRDRRTLVLPAGPIEAAVRLQPGTRLLDDRRITE